MYGLSPASGTESQSVRIESPAEAVWDLLTTIVDIAGWYDDWDTVEHDESDQRCLGPGVGFRLVRDRRGRIETARCVVAVFDPPHRLGWIEDGPLGRTVFVDFHLEADPTGGTVLTLGQSFDGWQQVVRRQAAALDQTITKL